jgi:hypothetical protein
MTLAPNTCLICGRGNTPDGVTGEIGPYIDLGIDYNWGDSGYFCMDCAGKLAVLAGWIAPDTQKDLKRRIERLQEKIHDLESTIELKRRRERAALRKARAA